MYAKITLLYVALMACTQLALAGRCTDHLLALKAKSWNEEDGGNKYDTSACTAAFSSFDRHLSTMHGLINEHIGQSLLYSIMSSHFTTDAENRMGFGKYMDEMADSMWDDAINMIKYVGKRGAGVAPLEEESCPGLRISELNVGVKPWTEIEALALALDRTQDLAQKVHSLHASTKDAALAEYLEEELVEDHVDRIRTLAGQLTNLVPMWQEAASKDLALYLFDKSLN